MITNLLHVVPILDNAMANWVIQRVAGRTLLGFVADVEIKIRHLIFVLAAFPGVNCSNACIRTREMVGRRAPYSWCIDATLTLARKQLRLELCAEAPGCPQIPFLCNQCHYR